MEGRPPIAVNMRGYRLVLALVALGCGKGAEPPAMEPACPAGPLFTTSPVALADFMGLTPLGHVAPPPHTFPSDHMYFYMRPNGVVPVVSPGAVKIFDVAKSWTGSLPPDYTVYFEPCRSYRGFFYHVSSLADSLLAQIGSLDDGECTTYTTGPNLTKRCQKQVSITVAAGDPIGTAGTVGGAAALDFGAMDARVPPLDYANPKRRQQWPDHLDALHIVCPLDAYEPGMRAALTARLSDYQGRPRTREPRCGEVMQDVKGTAQGIWFVAGTSEQMSYSFEDPHLALVHDNDFESQQDVISVGTSVRASGLDPGPYFFSPVSSGDINRRFRDVTADGSAYCYEHLGGDLANQVVILLAMPTATTLRIQRLRVPSCEASRPWTFEPTASQFER
jgi:hypothetical protein